MRLQPETRSPSPPPQRPSLLDTIDNSGARELHPSEVHQFDLVHQVRESPSSSDSTLSPASPSRKRRHSNPSPATDAKRPVSSRSSSRESSAAPEDHAGLRLDGGNPFKVQSHVDIFLQGPSGSSSRPQDQLHRSNVTYRSQQHLSYSRREEPSTPPTLRHRVRSLGPESPGGSPIRIDIRNWALRTDADSLDRVDEDAVQGESTPTRRLSPAAAVMGLVRTDGEHFTTLGQASDSQSAQTPTKARRLFDPEVVPSSVKRADMDMDMDMDQEVGAAQEDNKTPTRAAGRRISISSVSTKSLHNDSPISIRTISRRHSIADVDSPSFKTPTRSRRKSSVGRVIKDDGSLSSGRISSLPEGSPTGIDWSQSLETPAKRREAQGMNKTPLTNVIQRLRGIPTTPKRGEESPVAEFTDWNPSLETPPRKVSLIDKADTSESRISAKVLDELRGVPSARPLQPPRPAHPVEKQSNISSQEGSFYSAASSILSDDDDDYQNAAGTGSSGAAATADMERAPKVGLNTNANDYYPEGSELSPVVSYDHIDPVVDFPSIPSDCTGTLSASFVRDLEQGSPIIDSPVYSPVFPESQGDMFAGVTSAEINNALMSRSTQGSHHLTEPEGEHGGHSDIHPPAAGPSNWSHDASRNNTALTSGPVGFRSASGRVSFRVSEERLKAASRLFGDDVKDVIGDDLQGGDAAAVQALASNMLAIAGTSALQEIDADEIQLESKSMDRHRQMDIEQDRVGISPQDSPEVESDDDFGNIRFSQLDDGFNIVPEATQKPRKRSSVSSTTKRTPHIADDAAWMSRSSDMLGDLFEADDIAASSHRDSRQQSPSPGLGGGFSSAGGRKLTAMSKAALARAARMFGDEEGDVGWKHPELEAVVPEQHLPQTGSSSGFNGFGGFGGFSTAGNKALPQISDAARERAMWMMQDTHMDVDVGGLQESAHSAAMPFGDTSSSSGRQGLLPHQFGGGGFSSESGKKFAPASNVAMERWSKQFAEDDDDTGGVHGSAPSALMSASCMPSALGRPAPAPQQLGGFSSGAGKKLAPISKTAMEKWSKQLTEEDEADSGRPASEPAPQQLGGFSSGAGKKLAPISKVAMDKWSKQLAEQDDTESASRRASEPSRPHPPATPDTEVGFASGTGKALAPISKAAQARAYSFLELDQPADIQEARSVKPSVVHSRLSLPASNAASGFSGSSSSSRPPSVQAQPPISTHMLNLKNKTLRGSSKGLPGLMKPVLKSGVTPFKSPLHFKSPLRVPVRLVSDATNSATLVGTSASQDPAASIVGAQSSASRKQMGKRSTLHPTARDVPPSPIFSPAQPAQVAQSHATPSYSPIFNLQSEGERTTLKEALGTPKRMITQELLNRGLSEKTLFMTFEQARDYRFGGWGVDDAYQELLARGAKVDLLSRAWLSNHYGQVVWKLACYVRTWPEYFASSASEPSTWFCPTKVLDQLAYRYEREVNRAERPALRKIVEGDESAAKHMVLVIASISKVEQPSQEDGAAQESPWKILVSDGWYAIPAVLDPCLIKAIERGKLKVGSKVHVCRAKLSGAESGVAILELAGAGSESTTVSLVLQANSARLAKWDTKLGFQRAPLIWTKRLRTILPEGGLVPGLDVVVLRKYPVLYLETLEDGVTKVKRTAKDETLALEVHRENIQQRYQDMVRQVQKEFASEMDGEGRPSSRAQEEIMNRAQDLQAEVKARNVIPFFSIRVGNYRHGGSCDDDDMDENGRVQEALITFWHAEQTAYQEGHRVRVTSLVAKKLSREYGFEDVIQLTGTRMTTVQEMPTEPDTMLLTSYRPRSVTPCAEVGLLTPGTEVDLVFIILAVDERAIHSNKTYFVATDSSRRLLLVEHQLSTLPAASSVPGDDANRRMPSFFKVQNRILLANSRFKMRDHKLDLEIVSSSQSYTHITAASPLSGIGASGGGSTGWPSYAQSALQRLNAMVAEAENAGQAGGYGYGEETLLELMGRANAILTELHPSL
ncbi:Breast cancer 2, early onset [Mortierella sp. AD031]|nr:Breast cancer 2, early onset [Mortierella sp. AD031]